MKTLVKTILGATAIVAMAASAQASTKSVVNVTLWDKGSTSQIATDKGIGMTVDKSAATMGLKVSKTAVKAGDVTFKVTNGSKDTIHEMIVIPYKKGEKLPYAAADMKIDEDTAGHLGEVSELDPGKSGALTLKLKPGQYALMCNIPGHYMNGMWALITVK